MLESTAFLQETLCVAARVMAGSRIHSPAPMGHLAERYRDASRSGVYRVSDAAIPRAAAAEAGSACQVLLLEGLDALLPAELDAIVAVLKQVAAARRERGQPFFAVLLDPGRRLALPTLYKEKP
ncbi:MAG TPA: hypothetical protein VFZ94_12425 [Burkholderiales bacterium]